jgi:hypothetical protein
MTALIERSGSLLDVRDNRSRGQPLIAAGESGMIEQRG